MMPNFEPQNKLHNNSGFSLLEILVATVILAFSSLLIYNVVTGSFDINRKLTNDADTILSLNIAMQALERDISQIYSPKIGDGKLPENNNPTQFWSVPLRDDGLRRMRFQGGKEKISFISASNRKLQTDVKESELIKVIWQLIAEKDGTYSLVRMADPNVYDYDDQEASNQNLKKFRILEKLHGGFFLFYRGDKIKWEEQWDSEAPYTVDSSRYPTLIAIELSYPSPDNPDTILKWRSEFTPILAINGEKKDTSTTTGGGTNP